MILYAGAKLVIDGSLTVGEEMLAGRHVQFHLRDRQCSADDLKTVLERGVATGQLDEHNSHAALLFSCLGRGESLYGRPNHDSDMFRDIVGRLPLAGFFANGEIGPVQGSTHLHGFTSAFGLLREKKIQSP